MTKDGFSAAEREAMRARAEELRRQKGGGKKADNLQDVLDTIAGMDASDRRIAERLHALMTRVAPQLEAKTWYGFPAYAHGKDVVVFLKYAGKFDMRYAELGFNEAATLDDGTMWPTVYALTDWDEKIEKKVTQLVRKAVKGLVD